MTEHSLAKVKVLDLSHYIAGPYCTKILAGFGADVIKIEKPSEGDGARRMSPFLNDESGLERSGLFLYLNSNKKSITLNLKSNVGAKIFKELVKDADIVIESFRPGAIKKLGLDYPTLEKINPRLVMTSISNFGQTGPYRDYKSCHLITWGMSGGRYTDGEPNKRPIQSGGWLTHYCTGLHALVGTVTALYERNETGVGQQVDTSMFESTMLATSFPATLYSYNGIVHSSICKATLGIFPCMDGYIGVNVLTRPQWEMLYAFFGVPEPIEYFKPEDGPWGMNIDTAITELSPMISKREKMELFQSGVEWRLPFALIPTTQEILELPQHQAREFFEEVDHPVIGKVTMPGAPFKLGETHWQLRSPAPLLGQHNEEIYCQRLGYSKEELVTLRKKGVI